MTKTVASDTLDLADLDRRLEKAQRRYRRRSEKVDLARRSLLRSLEKLNKRECRIAELEISVVPGAVRVIVGNGPGLTAPVLAAPGAPAFADDPPIMTPALAEAQEGAVHDGAE